jgi:hypothetical protein
MVVKGWAYGRERTVYQKRAKQCTIVAILKSSTGR